MEGQVGGGGTCISTLGVCVCQAQAQCFTYLTVLHLSIGKLRLREVGSLVWSHSLGVMGWIWNRGCLIPISLIGGDAEEKEGGSRWGEGA